MPADVIGVCETIAKLKGVSLEEVATKTTENIRRLFYI
jgi:Tat protein secretion system quality control protein TatD with DNase activity